MSMNLLRFNLLFSKMEIKDSMFQIEYLGGFQKYISGMIHVHFLVCT